MRAAIVLIVLGIITTACAQQELTNPCAAVSCLEGSECVVVDGEGVCEPIGAGEATLCVGERPEVCTADYQPVCGVRESGVRETFSNACTACSAADVVSYTQGEC